MSIKNGTFCTTFYLYTKLLSHLRSVIEQILARPSILPSDDIVLLFEIDCSSSSSVFNYLDVG